MLLKNNNVTLGESVLLTGYSRKKSDSIGCHGEGMKLGVLLLLVAGASVKIFTGARLWQFYMSRERGAAEDTMFVDGHPCPPVSYTSVIITGFPSNAFRRNDFLPLTTNVYAVEASMCQQGSLLVFSNHISGHGSHIYVKGIFVRKEQRVHIPFNLLTYSKLNRDRDFVQDDRILSKQVAAIWGTLLQNERKTGNHEYTDKLLMLLQKHEGTVEVEMVRKLTREDVRVLMDFIRDLHGENVVPINTHDTEAAREVRDRLGRPFFPCSDALWRLLKKHNFAKPVSEIVQREFLKSGQASANVQSHPFFKALRRLLDLLQLQSLKIDVKNGSTLRSALKGNTLMLSAELFPEHHGPFDAVKVLQVVEDELGRERKPVERRKLMLRIKKLVMEGWYAMESPPPERTPPELGSPLMGSEEQEGDIAEEELEPSDGDAFTSDEDYEPSEDEFDNDDTADPISKASGQDDTGPTVLPPVVTNAPFANEELDAIETAAAPPEGDDGEKHEDETGSLDNPDNEIEPAVPTEPAPEPKVDPVEMEPSAGPPLEPSTTGSQIVGGDDPDVVDYRREGDTSSSSDEDSGESTDTPTYRVMEVDAVDATVRVAVREDLHGAHLRVETEASLDMGVAMPSILSVRDEMTVSVGQKETPLLVVSMARKASLVSAVDEAGGAVSGNRTSVNERPKKRARRAARKKAMEYKSVQLVSGRTAVTVQALRGEKEGCEEWRFEKKAMQSGVVGPATEFWSVPMSVMKVGTGKGKASLMIWMV